MTVETSMGRDTEEEGRDYIYLASVSLCEVHKGINRPVYLYLQDYELLQRVVIHHTDSCPLQQSGLEM